MKDRIHVEGNAVNLSWVGDDMRLKNVLIAVNDMDRAIRFYDPDGNLIEAGTSM